MGGAKTLHEQADEFTARRLGGITANALYKRKQAAAARAKLVVEGKPLRGPGRSVELDLESAVKVVAMAAANGKMRAKDVVGMLKYQEGILVSVSTVLRALRDCGHVPDSVMFFDDTGASLQKLLAAFDDTLKSIDICIYIFTNEEITKAVVAAKFRNATARVVSDYGQAWQNGCQLRCLIGEGIDVKLDHRRLHAR